MFTIAAGYQYRTDVLINSRLNSPALTIKTPSGLTANAIEAYKGTTLLFKVPAGGLRLESGIALTGADGLATKVFGQTFATAPHVVVSPGSLIPVTTNRGYVTNITTTQFEVVGHTNVNYEFIAVQ